ncbi:MAG TPA: NAD(P)-dependent oxidoreductase [Jiangellales bacterium]|nr:NAD(P)-dependent oxidoreductase [Jiangellales bacterium]
MTTTVGMAGLGIMGTGMARNLQRAGFDVVVWNRTRAKAETLAAEGMTVADDLPDLAWKADAVLVCVSDTPDVEEVVLGDGGLVLGLGEDSLVIDCSTISPAATRRVAAALADRGVAFVDAPVSGGAEGAAAGTLSVMVGGSESAVATARPCLEAIGSTVTHAGPVGAGQTCKLVNQVLVVVTMLGVSEALLLAEAGGLDPATAIAAVEGGAGGSWMLSNRGPQVVARDWRPGFTVDLQQKDLRLVLEAADELGLPLVATSLVSQLYRTLQHDGCGGEGNHALTKALERLSGITVGGRR